MSEVTILTRSEGTETVSIQPGDEVTILLHSDMWTRTSFVREDGFYVGCGAVEQGRAHVVSVRRSREVVMDGDPTVWTSTIIRVGSWQRAVTSEGGDLGRDVAAVIDGTTVIGHLWRLGERDYRAVLAGSGPGGCQLARNPDAPPVTDDGIYRPDEYARANRFDSEFAAMMAVARHHQIEAPDAPAVS